MKTAWLDKGNKILTKLRDALALKKSYQIYKRNKVLVCIFMLKFRYLIEMHEILGHQVILFYYHSVIEEVGETSSKDVFFCASFLASF